MKKLVLRLISIILTIVLLITSFSGCAAETIEADKSQYLTKGEWFAYFVNETDLQYSGMENELSIDESSPYYTYVMAIVDNEIIDSEIACKDLDKIVDKDTVAYTCVNHLSQAFREESELQFSDENKITDLKAATEAVEYGFVEGKSANKFGPSELMDIDSCKKAIDATIERITTYEFTEEENNFDIEYQDNVYETNDEVEVVEGTISDYTDYTEESGNANPGDVAKLDSNISIEMLGLKSSRPDVTNVVKNEDLITIRIPENIYNSNKNAYQVGNIVKLAPFEITTTYNNRPRTVECCYIKITSEPIKFGFNYNITGVLPSVDDAIKSINPNQRSTEKATNGSILETSDTSGVSGFQVTSSGAKFTYTNKTKGKVDLDNGRSNTTDPTLEADFTVSVEIKDIKLTTTGFDTILLDAVFGKPEATVGIKYSTNVTVEASFPETRLAPYNNGNGKFPSNLSRSRWTSGNGAKDIKIGKIKYAFGPIAAEFGLYLQIHLDGKITVSLEKDTNTTYTITKYGISQESSSKKTLNAKADLNLYAGVELRGDIHIIGLSNNPICDMKAGAGFNIQGTGNMFILNEEGKYTDKTGTNLSGEELQTITTTYKDNKFCYCLNIKLQFKIYGVIATGNCIIGKTVRFFKSDFDGVKGEKTFDIFDKHWEDGKEVDKCTREPDSGVKELDPEVKAGDKLDISDYNLALDSGSCGSFYVTEVPCKEKNKNKTVDTICVISTNPNVCQAVYFKENHMVEVTAVGEGTCQVMVMVRGGFALKFLSCAILVNENKQMSLVPTDTPNLNNLSMI